MKRVPLTQKHTSQTFIFVIARTLERMSYSGLRSMILMYMLKGDFGFSEQSVHSIYSLFITSFIVSQIIGALLGDLLLGNKKTFLIGGILQVAGALLLCIPDKIGLYGGLITVIIGSGLFSPNLFAAYCKQYINKPELMDSGLSIFYTVVNIGAFLGAFIGGIAGYTNFVMGFCIVAVLMTASLVLSFFTKETLPVENSAESKPNLNSRIVYVAGAILLSGIFWFVFDYANNGIMYIETSFFQNGNGSSVIYWSSFNAVFITIAGIAASIIWAFFNYSKLLKIVVGFFLSVISLGILTLIPYAPSHMAIIILMVSVLVFSIAEIHIGPVFYAIITKYANPKYLTIMISLSFVPYRLLVFISGMLLNPEMDITPLFISIGIFAVIGTGLLVFFLVKFKGTSNQQALEEPIQ